jgi:hypothetical protein
VIDVNVRARNGRQLQTALDKLPDTCPICHSAITPVDAGYGYMISELTDSKLEHTFRCPSEKCEHTFIARYERTKNPTSTHFEWRESLPVEPVDIKHSKIIATISPSFCEIYNQAHIAEGYNLDLIAGPGYRKALEFLIKDYLIAKHAEAEEKQKIVAMQLGNCIASYVKNEKISLTAARAAWLGNDETHFVRKWEDKDLKDLKVLIELTVRWIEMELMTAEAVLDMPVGRK